MPSRHSVALLLSTVAYLVSFAETDVFAERPVSFNRDVRAVLTDKCFACHGPDAETVEGDLRLDVRENSVEQSEVIVPGDPDASEFVSRILSDDPDERMPPEELHKPLSESEKDLLKRWIAEGAVYEPHWAYAPMKRINHADQPHPADSASQTIDAAVQSRLDLENVSPTGKADRVTLIRRLSFDLTGLPPTVQEVDAFLANDAEHAYANLVDRLLNSPRYGERMAVYWLDLVRYADTVGYHGDQNVSQSPYRDYVIDAFNQNMPYDQFVREQLAGDLLPEPTLSQKIASGYNRLNQTTEEGGSQAKEYLAIYFADRVRNVSQVYMGATVGCAQCHDHKYDPYTTKDFYSLGAFFADIEEKGVYGARSRPPTIRVPGEQLIVQMAKMDQEVKELEASIPKLQKSLLTEQAAWEAEMLQGIDIPTEVESVWVDDDQNIGGNRSGNWNFVSEKKNPVHSGDQSRRQKGAGTIQHLFDDTQNPFEVSKDSQFFSWVYLDTKNPPSAIMLQLNDGDWSQRKVWGADDIEYGRSPKSTEAYFRAGELPPTGQWVQLTVDASEVGLKEGDKVKGMAFTQFGGLVHWDKSGVIESSALPYGLVKALKTQAENRTQDQATTVEEAYLARAPKMMELKKQISDLQAAYKKAFESAPETVISKSIEPRTIRILPRGNWMDDSGEIVQPAIPEFLGSLSTDDARLTRLDLANWLSSDDNPLTSRTMVNRLWAIMFGRGICASVDDFGGQGTYPSYPELLDELALRFVESGWDIKQMLRTIALSETYQRSSTPTAQQLHSDPYNDLFARQGRFCVDAETVRDLALSASGLLVEQIGGPSVRPYQPVGYYAQLNFPKRKYESDQGDAQYRRGLYTHWQRTFLHPMLKAFDAPSREECTARRARSNTPLQALVLLNDPTFVEAARVFAQRIVTQAGSTPEQKIQWAYRSVVSRNPSVEITHQLKQIYDSHLEKYRAEPDSAALAVTQGNSPVPEGMDQPTLAAWTSVARVILNLHETITRY